MSSLSLQSAAPTRTQELEQTVAQVLQQAVNHQQSGENQAAEDLYRAILDIQPKHADANHNLGILLAQLQQPLSGLPFLRAALEANPEGERYWLSYIEALLLAGQKDVAAQTLALGRRHGLQGPALEELASRMPAQALDVPPQVPPQIPLAGPRRAPRLQDINKLTGLQRKGRSAEIETFAQRLTVRFPDHGLGWKTLGCLLEEQGREDEALLPLQKAVEFLPEDADVCNDLGVILQKKVRIAEAETLFCQALKLKPDFPAALNNLGNLYRGQGRLAESEANFRRALELEPGAIVYNNLAATLLDLGRIVDAENCYRLGLKIKPDSALLHTNLGVSLRYQGRLGEAIASQRRALKLSSYSPEQHSNLLFTLNYTSAEADSSHLEEARSYGRRVSKKVKTPFSSWQCAPRPDRLRVGLVSGDLYNHPVGFFLESLLGQLDPARVELFAYPTNPKTDDLTTRVKPRFAAWQPLFGLSDEAAAATIHGDGVHVLLDLSGHTSHNRLPMFVRKPAPVQVSWLGYFATTGVTAIDYFLADAVGVPASQQENFTESLRYLPATRLCFSAPQFDLPVAPLPAREKDYITFGCFQRLTKVGDDVLKLWSDILAALPTARLRWQCAQLGDPAVAAQFVQRLQSHAINPARVTLQGAVSRCNYLAAHAEVDVILDTFPYPGGTTTCEALWMGVPTLTLAGSTLLSRQGASLLTAAGLEDWVTGSEADYLAKAIAVASDLPLLADLRARLRAQVLASPLFDAQQFARNFEAGLWGMWLEKQPREESCSSIAQNIIAGGSRGEGNLAKTFLHVGCGPQSKEVTTQGFNTAQWTELRLDINEAVHPDIVGTMTDMSRVADASVDAIFSSHNIEHLYPHEVSLALKEFHRVLKPDGFAVITCPDLQSVCALVAADKLADAAYQSAAGPIAPIDILYGHRPAMARGNLFMAHRCGFTEKVLSDTLRAAGFAAVATMARPAAFDLWAVASKSLRGEDELRALTSIHFVRPGSSIGS